MLFEDAYRIYIEKINSAFFDHDISIARGHFDISANALLAAKNGDWTPAVKDFTNAVESALGKMLTPNHGFLKSPYVRKFDFDYLAGLSVAIVNEQSLEWYGREGAVGAFDFLLEFERGLFDGCTSFLDLGGHQMVWACFYAKSSPDARVVSYEPSILNVAIGLFNCFLNGVVQKVDVVPFAVLATNSAAGDENSKMLVDFMNVSLRGQKIDVHCDRGFDFVKTDIEGYELELLGCKHYAAILKGAKHSHLELHLGHLIGRGIGVKKWVDILRAARLEGAELYSGQDMYAFLEKADPKGYYSFIVN